MRKFFAVLKREYLKLVWSRTFVIGTLLAPLMAIGFTVVPALIFSIEGAPTRVAIVDRSGKLFSPISAALMLGKRRDQSARDALNEMNQSQEERLRRMGEETGARFLVEEVKPENRTNEQIKRELNGRLREQTLDAYVVIPENFEDADFDLFARNTSDFVAQSRIENALNEAVREARLEQANLSKDKLSEINREVTLNSVRVSDAGEAEDSGESFWLVFVVGFAGLYGIALLLRGRRKGTEQKAV